MRDFLRLLRKLLGLLLLGGGTVMFLVGVLVCWVLRDGLGPDGVTSHGIEAVARFARGFWEFLLVSVALWAAGAFLLRGVIP